MPDLGRLVCRYFKAKFKPDLSGDTKKVRTGFENHELSGAKL
jgi:hypothetical protein